MITAKEFGILTGCLIRSALSIGGSDAVRAVSKAVRLYGVSRGKAIAEAAKKLGQPLDWVSFIACYDIDYAELFPSLRLKKEGTSTMLSVTECPLNNVWCETGFQVYGRSFCENLFESILIGFNPSLKAYPLSLLSNGQVHCCHACYSFIYSNAIGERIANIRDQIDLDSYTSLDRHAGLLYKCFSNTFVQDLGSPLANQILRSALNDISELTDKQVTEEIRLLSAGSEIAHVSDELIDHYRSRSREEMYEDGFPPQFFNRK